MVYWNAREWRIESVERVACGSSTPWQPPPTGSSLPGDRQHAADWGVALSPSKKDDGKKEDMKENKKEGKKEDKKEG